MFLRSSISVKHLKKHMETRRARAHHRGIGLRLFAELYENCPTSIMRQDVVSWLVASLRTRGTGRKESKRANSFLDVPLSHALDDLEGAGASVCAEVEGEFHRLLALFIAGFREAADIALNKIRLAEEAAEAAAAAAAGSRCCREERGGTRRQRTGRRRGGK